MKDISEVNMSKHHFLMKYEDLFVLCCVAGLRLSDFSDLKVQDIHNGMLYKKQAKSNQWVVIHLRAKAIDIFINELN